MDAPLSETLSVRVVCTFEEEDGSGALVRPVVDLYWKDAEGYTVHHESPGTLSELETFRPLFERAEQGSCSYEEARAHLHS